MSVVRILGAVAVAAALVILLWQRDDGGAPTAQAPATAAPASALAPAAPSTATEPAEPALPDEPPFGDRDLAITTDMPDGPVVVLRSSARTGNALQIELATREPLAEGKRVYAVVSVSDALGNTILDCTWRDIALSGDDTRKLDCELPAGVELPLAISGSQMSAPSFIENPTVVAVDRRAP